MPTLTLVPPPDAETKRVSSEAQAAAEYARWCAYAELVDRDEPSGNDTEDRALPPERQVRLLTPTVQAFAHYLDEGLAHFYATRLFLEPCGHGDHANGMRSALSFARTMLRDALVMAEKQGGIDACRSHEALAPLAPAHSDEVAPPEGIPAVPLNDQEEREQKQRLDAIEARFQADANVASWARTAFAAALEEPEPPDVPLIEAEGVVKALKLMPWARAALAAALAEPPEEALRDAGRLAEVFRPRAEAFIADEFAELNGQALNQRLVRERGLGITAQDAPAPMEPGRLLSGGRRLPAQLQPGLRLGAVVTNVIAGGPAEAAGLMPGDVVTSVADIRVKDARSLTSALEARGAPGKDLSVEICRGERSQLVTLTLRPWRRSPGPASPA